MNWSDSVSRDGANELDSLLCELTTERRHETALRENILRLAEPMIDEIIESSFSGSGHPRDALYRAGYLGLLNAVYNYDLSHGKPFREYAENLIKGEIRQHIRDEAEPPRIPGWMDDLNRQVEQAQARFLQIHGHLPTLSELAETANITEDGLSELFKAREAVNYVSLGERARKSDPLPEIDVSRIQARVPSPFPIQMRIRIAMALERLSDIQQDLFRSLFAKD